MTQVLNKKMHKDLVEQDTIRTRWELTFSFVTKESNKSMQMTNQHYEEALKAHFRKHNDLQLKVSLKGT